MMETRHSPQPQPLQPQATPPQEGGPAQGTSANLTPLEIARLSAETLESRKLADVAIFDVSKTLQIADYFVLASGVNFRQIKTACHEVEMELRRLGIRTLGIEGYAEGKWVLLDFDTVVVHVFHEEQRRYYDLELLWGDSPKIDFGGGQASDVGNPAPRVDDPEADA